jgi:hypothetical protein
MKNPYNALNPLERNVLKESEREYDIVKILKFKTLSQLTEARGMIETLLASVSMRDPKDRTFADRVKIKVYQMNISAIDRRMRDIARQRKNSTEKYNNNSKNAMMTAIKAAAQIIAHEKQIQMQKEERARNVMTKAGYDPLSDPMIKNNRAIQLTVVEGKSAQEAQDIIEAEAREKENTETSELIAALNKNADKPSIDDVDPTDI